MKNKYQEAKETLEKYDYSTKLELSEGIRNNLTSGITVEQFFMTKEVCIELLDKETPIKPYKDGKKYKCSRCKLQRVSSRYCGDCGQKIDWSKDE